MWTRADEGGRLMAEREGFEPSIRFCRILTFQASAFDHSATAPHALEDRASSKVGARGQATALLGRLVGNVPRIRAPGSGLPRRFAARNDPVQEPKAAKP